MIDASSSSSPAPRWGRLQWSAALAALLLLVALGTFVRASVALEQRVFDAEHPEAMLKADPALLYYIVERIVDAGGGVPSDFRADPRIEHPELTDIPATFTVGLEFLVAWAYLALDKPMPLHVFCVGLSALLASLCVVGIFGLCWELSRSIGWSLVAACLFTLVLANYRTLGFILIREDLALPLFCLHLWLFARAVRSATVASICASALMLVSALATWHAMRFVVSIEALCVFAWFARHGENPLRSARSWLFAGLLTLGTLVVPVLWSRVAVLSFPVILVLSLVVVALVERRVALAGWRRLAAAGALIAALMVLRQLIGAGNDYRHVFGVLLAKLMHGGDPPVDPADLTIGARILWQGPFQGASPHYLIFRLGVLGTLLPVAFLADARDWWRRPTEGRSAVLTAFALLALVASVLFRRLAALLGLVAPVVAVLLLRRVRSRSSYIWAVGVLIPQLLLFRGHIGDMDLSHWYEPAEMTARAAGLRWISANLPEGGAVSTDYLNGSAVLALTGHPIVLQPKYESTRTLDRIAAWSRSLYHSSPEEHRRLLLDRFRARYAVVDVQRIWSLRYAAGLPLDAKAPPPGSAAAHFLSGDPRVYGQIRGFRLLRAIPPERPLWRIYEIVQDAGD